VRVPRLNGGAARVLLALLVLTGTSACEDLRAFRGEWAGPVSADPQLRLGFAPEVTLAATLGAVTRAHAAATLTLPGRAPLPFLPVRQAAGDALGDLRLTGEPLRSYLGFVEPPGEAPLLVVLSLFPEERIEARVIRGAEELYGVFTLRRVGGSR
jgi:hypothetical protein